MADEPKVPQLLNPTQITVQQGNINGNFNFAQQLANSFAGGNALGGGGGGGSSGGFGGNQGITGVNPSQAQGPSTLGQVASGAGSGAIKAASTLATTTNVFQDAPDVMKAFSSSLTGGTGATGKLVEMLGKVGIQGADAAKFIMVLADRSNQLNKTFVESAAQSGILAGEFSAMDGVLDHFGTNLDQTVQDTGLSLEDANKHVSKLLRTSLDIGQAFDGVATPMQKIDAAFENFATMAQVARNAGVDLDEAVNRSQKMFREQGITLDKYSALMAGVAESIDGTGVSTDVMLGKLDQLGESYQFLEFDVNRAALAMGEVAKRQAMGTLNYKSTEQAVKSYAKALEATADIQQDLGKSLFFGSMAQTGGKFGLEAALDFEDLDPSEALKQVSDAITGMTGGKLYSKTEAKAEGPAAMQAFAAQRQMVQQNFGMKQGEATKFMDLLSQGVPVAQAKEQAKATMEGALDKSQSSDQQYQKMIYTQQQISNSHLGPIQRDISAMPDKLLRRTLSTDTGGKISDAIKGSLGSVGDLLNQYTYTGSAGDFDKATATPVGTGTVLQSALETEASTTTPSTSAGAVSSASGALSGLGIFSKAGTMLVEAATALKQAAQSLFGGSAPTTAPSSVGPAPTVAPAITTPTPQSESSAPPVAAPTGASMPPPAASSSDNTTQQASASPTTSSSAPKSQKLSLNQSKLTFAPTMSSASPVGYDTMTSASAASLQDYAMKSSAQFDATYALPSQQVDKLTGKPEQGTAMLNQGIGSAATQGSKLKTGTVSTFNTPNLTANKLGDTSQSANSGPTVKVLGPSKTGDSYAEALPKQIGQLQSDTGTTEKYPSTNLSAAEQSALALAKKFQSAFANVDAKDPQAAGMIVQLAENEKAEWRLDQGVKAAQTANRSDLGQMFQNTRNMIASARAVKSPTGSNQAGVGSKVIETTKTIGSGGTSKSDIAAISNIMKGPDKTYQGEGINLPQQGISGMDAFKGSSKIKTPSSSAQSKMSLAVPTMDEMKNQMKASVANVDKPSLATSAKSAQTALEKSSDSKTSSGSQNMAAAQPQAAPASGGSGGKTEIVVKVMLKEKEIAQAVVGSETFENALAKAGGSKWEPKKNVAYKSGGPQNPTA